MKNKTSLPKLKIIVFITVSILFVTTVFADANKKIDHAGLAVGQQHGISDYVKNSDTKKIKHIEPKRYSELLPQLCYINEQGKTQCTVISASGSNIKSEELTLQQADVLSEITKNLAKTIQSVSNDSRYPGAIVYDLSYSVIRAQANGSHLTAPQDMLLKQQLILFDQISARFAASPSDEINYSQSELDALHAALLGSDRSMQITGTPAEQARLGQVFDDMLKNRIGFERAATLAIMHLVQANQPITINSTTNGSDAIYSKRIVNIAMIDKIGIGLPATLCHELSHIYHHQITGYDYNSSEKLKLLMESALADNAIAYIYKYFPALKDIEKATAQYIPTDEERKNINIYIRRINETGLGKLINNIEQDDSKLSVTDVAKIIFIAKWCTWPIYDKTSSIWTDPEEILTIVGELTFRNNGQRIVIIDTQNEHAFVDIANTLKRIGHTTESRETSKAYDEDREFLSALEKHHGSVIKNTICQHLKLELTDNKIKNIIESIQHDELMDLKCIDLSGATINSKLTIETIFDLLKIAAERNIKVVLPQKLDTHLQEKIKQEINQKIHIKLIKIAQSRTYSLFFKKFNVAGLDLQIQAEPEIIKQEISQKIKFNDIELAVDFYYKNIQAHQDAAKLAAKQETNTKFQEELATILSLMRETIKLAKQKIVMSKTPIQVQKELDAITQQSSAEIKAVLEIIDKKIDTLIKTEFESFIQEADTLNQAEIEIFKNKFVQQTQDELKLAKQAVIEAVQNGKFVYKPYAMSYLNQLTADELCKITDMNLSATTNADADVFVKLAEQEKLVNITNIDIFADHLGVAIDKTLLPTILSNLEANKLPKLSYLHIINMQIPSEMAKNIVAIVDAKKITLFTSDKIIIKQKIDPGLNHGVLKYNRLTFYDIEYLSNLTEDSLSKITNLDFTEACILKDNVYRAIVSLLGSGKLNNLTTINMGNLYLGNQDEFISTLVDAVMANKLPCLKTIELSGNNYLSEKSRNLLHGTSLV